MYNVMIVEDDAIFRAAISTLVDWDINGYHLCGIAKNGVHALEIFDDCKPDIILTDISMPEMDGIKLIKEINGRYGDIKVIVLSAYDDFQFVKDALKLGAIDYILKQEMDSKGILDRLNEARQLIKEDKERRNLENLFTHRKLKYLIENFIDEFKYITPHPGFSENMAKVILAGDREAISNEVDKFFAEDNNDIGDGMHPAILLIELLSVMYHLMKNIGMDVEEMLGDEYIYDNQLEDLNSAEEKIVWFKTYFYRLCDSISDKEKGYRKEVKQIIDIIRSRYSSDITLEVLARELDLSENYVSRIFHTETGLRITEYLNKVRIEEAEKLLRFTNLRVYEISERVGFNNVSYFCTVFKRLTGKTVSEFTTT